MQIGVPASIQENNPLKKVEMSFSPNSRKNSQEATTGDVLNKLTGSRASEKGIYVDGKQHNKLGKDEFLKLLSHQLANQDPMNPMDQKDFSGQLAQFSQLEQLANMNSSMKELTGNAPTEQKFQAASFIGKRVQTFGSTMNFEPGKISEAGFKLPSDASKVMIRVMDDSNQVVRQVEFDNLKQGAQTFNWDGAMNDGNMAGKGQYTIIALAWDQNQMPMRPEMHSSGIVSGVSFDNNEVILNLEGSQKVYLRDVISFSSDKLEASSSLDQLKNMPGEKINKQAKIESFNKMMGSQNGR
jgi:flagellar basal-body rod modification protein FlgD